MDALGRESAEQLLAVKHFEWEKYCEANPDWESKRETVTDWELKFYTPYNGYAQKRRGKVPQSLFFASSLRSFAPLRLCV